MYLIEINRRVDIGVDMKTRVGYYQVFEIALKIVTDTHISQQEPASLVSIFKTIKNIFSFESCIGLCLQHIPALLYD